MATIKDVEDLGYMVGTAFVGADGVSVLCVSGNGIETYMRADDQAQIDSLADLVLHAQRIAPPPPPDPAPVPGAVVQQQDGTFGIVVSSTSANVDVAPLAPAVATDPASVTVSTV